MSAGAERILIDAVPLNDQERAWREALASIGLSCRIVSPTALRSGDVTVRTPPSGTRLALLRASAQKITSVGQAPSATVAIIFHEAGRGRVSAGSRTCEFADGDLSVCDLGAAWSMDLRDDFELLVVEIPRERFFGRLGRHRIELPAVLGATVAAAAARPVMRTLAANIAAGDIADFTSLEIAVVELVASALLGEAKAHGEVVTQVQAGHLRRVYAAIESRLAEPDLSMADIARQEHVSQRYLQKLFERQKTTFSNHLRQRRLDRCRLDLIDPNHADESISEIAFRWGFRDQATFSRAFSAAFGRTPRETRKATPLEPERPPNRGRPLLRTGAQNPVVRPNEPTALIDAAAPAVPPQAATQAAVPHYLAVSKDTVHWGYLGRSIPPKLRVDPGACVTIETLTQHAFDDYERMIKGDAGAESVYYWTADGKAVDRRGAGPMNSSIFGRGAGEGFGVHICTGPVHVNGAEPGDVLEVRILDIRPRPCANPKYSGKAFGSNAAAWWGFQYGDPIDRADRREVVTIFETDLASGARFAEAAYSYRWTPQIDPYGVRHDTMDYPGVPVDSDTIEKRPSLVGVRIPARPHFGFMAVAPREAEVVDSIPPGYFGGNIDNWRAAKGTSLFLPVAVPGALFSVGDPHFAQGDGEINGTALEFSLTGDFQLVLHKKGEATEPYLASLSCPLLETPDEWVLHGFSYPNYLRELGRFAQSEIYKKSSIDLALRNVFRAARKFLMEHYGLHEDDAVALMSLAVDFGVTQVADGNWGVHAVIKKRLFT